MSKDRLSIKRATEAVKDAEKRRIVLYRILTRLGVIEEFKQDDVLKRLVLSLKYRPPKIAINSDVNSDIALEFTESIKEFLNYGLDGLTVSEFLTHAPALMSICKHGKSRLKKVCDEKLAECMEILGQRSFMLRVTLFEYSNPTKIYYAIDTRWAVGRFEITLKKIPSVKIITRIDGQKRVAYRLVDVTTNSLEPIHNIVPGSNHKVPVYATEHALRRLNERIDIDDRGTFAFTIIHASMVSAKPFYYRGDCLIPIEWYRNRIKMANGEFTTTIQNSNPQKLGYMVGRVAPEGIICLTFLLASMIGTPEGDVLHTALQSCNYDVEYNKLDRLSTFVGSDICSDQRIRKLTGGHIDSLLDLGTRIAELSTEGGRSPTLKYLSDDIVRYFTK